MAITTCRGTTVRVAMSELTDTQLDELLSEAPDADLLQEKQQRHGAALLAEERRLSGEREKILDAISQALDTLIDFLRVERLGRNGGSINRPIHDLLQMRKKLTENAVLRSRNFIERENEDFINLLIDE
jgi:hypothetical protein